MMLKTRKQELKTEEMKNKKNINEQKRIFSVFDSIKVFKRYYCGWHSKNGARVLPISKALHFKGKNSVNKPIELKPTSNKLKLSRKLPSKTY